MTSRTSARRSQLTAIAGALFARDGYHNVTVGDIAAEAGLSGPAIYRHFPGKQALLAEVMRSGFEEMARDVFADLSSLHSSDPATRLRAAYRELAAFVIRRPEFGLLWRREHRHLAPGDAVELAKRMSEGSDAVVGELRRMRPALGEGDAELLSWAALSVLGSISDHRVRLPRAAFEELLAGIAMDVVSVELGSARDNRPQEIDQPENRKEQLLAAAARLFWDRGYHGVTMEEIGAAAGIAGPSVYSHFAGKTDLLRTMTERIGERLRSTLEPALDLAAPAAARDGDTTTTGNAEAAEVAALATAGTATAARAEVAEQHTEAAAGNAEAAEVAPPHALPAAADTATAARAEVAAHAAQLAAAALADLATRYVQTVLASRDLIAAYFTEGHNLPDRDRAETRRFQRAYVRRWVDLLSAARPDRSEEEVRIRVHAAFAVVNDTARTRRFLDRTDLAAALRSLMLGVLLTPSGNTRDVNHR